MQKDQELGQTREQRQLRNNQQKTDGGMGMREPKRWIPPSEKWNTSGMLMVGPNFKVGKKIGCGNFGELRLGELFNFLDFRAHLYLQSNVYVLKSARNCLFCCEIFYTPLIHEIYRLIHLLVLKLLIFT